MIYNIYIGFFLSHVLLILIFNQNNSLPLALTFLYNDMFTSAFGSHESHPTFFSFSEKPFHC